MDDFETTLARVIDNVVALQDSQALAGASRNPRSLFPLVLKVRAGLQALHAHPDRDHPLQELAREVKLALRKEFNALLLAAFNWRSAAFPKPKRQPPRPKVPPAKVVPGGRTRVDGRPQPKSQTRRGAPKPSPRVKPKKRAAKQGAGASGGQGGGLTPEQKAQAQHYAQKFLRDLEAFVRSPAGRLAAKKKEYVDIYRAGRRMPGSFGART